MLDFDVVLVAAVVAGLGEIGEELVLGGGSHGFGLLRPREDDCNSLLLDCCCCCCCFDNGVLERSCSLGDDGGGQHDDDESSTTGPVAVGRGLDNDL